MIQKTINKGTRVMESNEADSMANVLVNANGWNNLPSCASRVNTGIKETAIINKEKNSGLPTCCGFDNHCYPVTVRLLLQFLVRIFDHNDCGIDHGPNGNGDPA